MKKQTKTNAMRLLERAGVPYEAMYYNIADTDFSGEAVSALLHIEPERFFKTLCIQVGSGQLALCLVAVNRSLNLKTVAAHMGGGTAKLLPPEALKAAVGCERGSVTPLGIQKQCTVLVDDSALRFDTIAISAGQKGASVLLPPRALGSLAHAEFISGLAK